MIRWGSFVLRPSFTPEKDDMPPIDTTPVSAIIKLAAAELDLIADALTTLYFRAPERRPEVLAFAVAHPELNMLYTAEEPTPEEDL